VFAHLHVSMIASVCPPAGSALPAAATASTAVAWWGVSSAAMAAASHWLRDGASAARRIGIAALLMLAFACSAGALASALWGHDQAGLAPKTSAWAATVGVMLAWQAFHTAVIALMAAFVGARLWCGLLAPRHRAPMDNVALFWHWASLQGAIAVAFVQLLPRWM